jgi:hypothetical protein
VDAVVPQKLLEYAETAVNYVRIAVGVAPSYDSDTLPLVDHYLNSVPPDEPATIALMVQTVGAYFGEVVRRNLGGRWEGGTGLHEDWRMVLPTGLSFSPTGFVAAAIAKSELEDFDAEIDAPARMKPHVQQALARMGEVPVDEFYSLCNRLDTLEHVHEVLVAVAAQMLGDAGEADGDAVEPVADEPSGGVIN